MTLAGRAGASKVSYLARLVSHAVGHLPPHTFIPCLAACCPSGPLPGRAPLLAGVSNGGQNEDMPNRLRPPDIRRRSCLLAALPWLPTGAPAAEGPFREAMRRAEALRDEALRAGDQPFGAVVLRGELIVGAAPSRVVTATDPTAHAEMEAIRDAARRMGTRDLSGCVLVSTSRPCRMCEAAAGWAGIARMVYGEALTDAGPPR